MDATSCYDALCKKIRGEWMTRHEAKTDAKGAVKFRGFHGDYALRLLQDSRVIHGGSRFSIQPGRGTQSVTLAV